MNDTVVCGGLTLPACRQPNCHEPAAAQWHVCDQHRPAPVDSRDAEAERDRLRACLSVLLRDIDEGEVTGGDPECVDLSITVNRADLDEARAALDGEDTA